MSVLKELDLNNATKTRFLTKTYYTYQPLQQLERVLGDPPAVHHPGPLRILWRLRAPVVAVRLKQELLAGLHHLVGAGVDDVEHGGVAAHETHLRCQGLRMGSEEESLKGLSGVKFGTTFGRSCVVFIIWSVLGATKSSIAKCGSRD
jgi:hypothetical protein